MNQKKIFYYLSLLAALFITFTTACSDDDGPIDEEPEQGIEALLILSEGRWGKNESTLSRYDIEMGEIIKDYFRAVNQRRLGDTGNDMIRYGSKIYIVVNGSSIVEVVDAVTGKSLRQIAMKQEDGSAKQPRQIASHDGKVYVTSFDDTVTRIDSVSLQIDGTVEVGLAPEGIVIKNNKIWVANSGGLNYENGYDNTVSVIDALTFKEEKKIKVGTNPANLQADNQGNIYVSVLGNRMSDDPENYIPPAFKRINPASGVVTTIEEVTSPDRFVIWDNKAYIISGSYGNKVVVYDCFKEELVSDNFVTDGTELGIIYNIAADEKTGDIFLMELDSDYTTPGSVHCFSNEGKLKYTVPRVGINPTAVIVMN
jgi:YVTN family beta-propeller protein